MKVLIIGGKGTIGHRVSNHLAKRHEVIIAGRNSGDITVDITDSKSIKSLFITIGKVDAIVCVAGAAKWAPFDTLSEEDYYIAIKSKLMGQVNLVRIGCHYLNSGGSITLTTGITADDPVLQTASAAMANGGIHGFVKAVSRELKGDLRINVVSPGLVADAAEKFESYFPGYNPIPMDKVVNGYLRSIEGAITGEVIRIYN